MEPSARVELATPSLPRTCSTPELRGLAAISGAGDGARTRAQQLGRLGLYQLSYSRVMLMIWWREEGSNLRRSLDRQIYSLLLLTTQPSLHATLPVELA